MVGSDAGADHARGSGSAGPIADGDPRDATVQRLVNLFEQTAREGAELFSYHEQQMPHQGVEPLLEASERYGAAVTFGYAEATPERRLFNTASVLEGFDELLRYRKVHLPGYHEVQLGLPFQNLEKKFFETGNQGFPVTRWRSTQMGVAICNDRRWPEVYRLLALQGAELVSIGYNTPRHTPGIPEADHLNDFHHRLVMQAGYTRTLCESAARAKWEQERASSRSAAR